MVDFINRVLNRLRKQRNRKVSKDSDATHLDDAPLSFVRSANSRDCASGDKTTSHSMRRRTSTTSAASGSTSYLGDIGMPAELSASTGRHTSAQSQQIPTADDQYKTIIIEKKSGDQLGLRLHKSRLEVVYVQDGSPIHSKGVTVGDVLVQVQGRKVTVANAKHVLRQCREAERVTLVLSSHQRTNSNGRAQGGRSLSLASLMSTSSPYEGRRRVNLDELAAQDGGMWFLRRNTEDDG